MRSQRDPREVPARPQTRPHCRGSACPVPQKCRVPSARGPLAVSSPPVGSVWAEGPRGCPNAAAPPTPHSCQKRFISVFRHRILPRLVIFFLFFFFSFFFFPFPAETTGFHGTPVPDGTPWLRLWLPSPQAGCWGQGVRVLGCQGVVVSGCQGFHPPSPPHPCLRGQGLCAGSTAGWALLRFGFNPWRAAPGVQVTPKPLPLSPPGLGSGPCLGLGLGGFAGLGIWGTCCPLGAARALVAALAVCAESGRARRCRGHCRPQRGADPRLRLRVPMLPACSVPCWLGWRYHAGARGGGVTPARPRGAAQPVLPCWHPGRWRCDASTYCWCFSAIRTLVVLWGEREAFP